MRGYGKKAVHPNGPLLLRKDLPREANLFLLIRLSVGEMDTSHDFLYPDDPAFACPVVKADQLSPEQQVAYIQWILCILKIDPKIDKDPRVYCAYCDMNNHPRFTCKHAWKHRNPNEKHHCTLCAGKHPPFLCPRAQVNGGPGQPNWYKCEHKRAKQENPEADYRWGPSLVTHTDVDGPDATSQLPSEAPQPQCAAAAMMHGMSMTPASSHHGGCPYHCRTPGVHIFYAASHGSSMEPYRILPNPGYS